MMQIIFLRKQTDGLVTIRCVQGEGTRSNGACAEAPAEKTKKNAAALNKRYEAKFRIPGNEMKADTIIARSGGGEVYSKRY